MLPEVPSSAIPRHLHAQRRRQGGAPARVPAVRDAHHYNRASRGLTQPSSHREGKVLRTKPPETDDAPAAPPEQKGGKTLAAVPSVSDKMTTASPMSMTAGPNAP
jgi:hypothetical protein